MECSDWLTIIKDIAIFRILASQAWYLLSILDANVDASLFNYDISNNLDIAVIPAILPFQGDFRSRIKCELESNFLTYYIIMRFTVLLITIFFTLLNANASSVSDTIIIKSDNNAERITRDLDSLDQFLVCKNSS